VPTRGWAMHLRSGIRLSSDGVQAAIRAFVEAGAAVLDLIGPRPHASRESVGCITRRWMAREMEMGPRGRVISADASLARIVSNGTKAISARGFGTPAIDGKGVLDRDSESDNLHDPEELEGLDGAAWRSGTEVGDRRKAGSGVRRLRARPRTGAR
jgi:hypothetical protein